MTSKTVRTLFRSSLIAAAAVALAPLSAHAGGASIDMIGEAAASQADYANNLIIKYRAGSAARAHANALNMAIAHAALLQSGAQMNYYRTLASGAHVMQLNRAMPIRELEAAARAMVATDPNIEFAEPDRRAYKALVPTDAEYTKQWHYYERTAGINAPTAWDASTGSGVVVAVLDTGYRPHVDLAKNIVSAGYDMVTNFSAANDGNGRDGSALDPGDWHFPGQCSVNDSGGNSSWHGTHVSGTIAALTNNGAGVAGVAFGAKILPVRVLGKCGGQASDMADAIVWAAGGWVSGVPANATPARVINMSVSGTGSCPTAMQNAINFARSRNTVVVVAAGNNNKDSTGYWPANCSGVISVAAVGRTGAKAAYSNFGSLVTLAAPGGDMANSQADGVYSTLNSGSMSPAGDSYAFYQGTSMATPHVVGTVALMLAKKPSLTPDQVASLLKSTVRSFPRTCNQCGAGLLDSAAAVAAASR
jgi:serine protease